MESNYKKLTAKITKLEKGKMKKEEKIKELQNSLKEENKELKQLYAFKEAFEKTSNELDQYFINIKE
ncbi:MAG: hypothetical protein ACLSGH_07990 [Faecalibacillus intestinalis]|uniref:hypothetical protein n=1 Tax=Faecalibacillus intestinalis TaxID=1982626 RepID=UPI0039965549|nr:hypothetical protein [Coprobacillus sp.]